MEYVIRYLLSLTISQATCRAIFAARGIPEDKAWTSHSAAPVGRVQLFETGQDPGPDLARPRFWLGPDPKPIEALWNNCILNDMLKDFSDRVVKENQCFELTGRGRKIVAITEDFMWICLKEKFLRGLSEMKRAAKRRASAANEEEAKAEDRKYMKTARKNTRRNTVEYFVSDLCSIS